MNMSEYIRGLYALDDMIDAAMSIGDTAKVQALIAQRSTYRLTRGTGV